MTVVSDSHYQSTLDTVYVYVVPWSSPPTLTTHKVRPLPTLPRTTVARERGGGGGGPGGQQVQMVEVRQGLLGWVSHLNRSPI